MFTISFDYQLLGQKDFSTNERRFSVNDQEKPSKPLVFYDKKGCFMGVFEGRITSFSP
jgi:hypothetical protein